MAWRDRFVKPKDYVPASTSQMLQPVIGMPPGPSGDYVLTGTGTMAKVGRAPNWPMPDYVSASVEQPVRVAPWPMPVMIDFEAPGTEPQDVQVVQAGYVPTIKEALNSVAGDVAFRPRLSVHGKKDYPHRPGDRMASSASRPIPAGDMRDYTTGRVRMRPQPIFPGRYTDWPRADPAANWRPFGKGK